MPGLSFKHDSTDGYRFGFNNQERDGELGDYYAFEYRVHDARLGRFLSVDPLARSYPSNSTYAFAENRILASKELEGCEAVNATNYYANGLPGYVLVLQPQNNIGPLIFNQQNVINGGAPTFTGALPGSGPSLESSLMGRNGYNSWRVDPTGNAFLRNGLSTEGGTELYRPILFQGIGNTSTTVTIPTSGANPAPNWIYFGNVPNNAANAAFFQADAIVRVDNTLQIEHQNALVNWPANPAPTGIQPIQNIAVATIPIPPGSGGGNVQLNAQVQQTRQTVTNQISNVTCSLMGNTADQVLLTNIMNGLRANPRNTDVTFSLNLNAGYTYTDDLGNPTAFSFDYTIQYDVTTTRTTTFDTKVRAQVLGNGVTSPINNQQIREGND